ncbi:uncharacterized protein LOC111323246 [Stylophora pistillata]|uniref:Uncharacterized protein n=1 Tax=Stylophora pistillata TaxID=50429 RepID=A0A2B4SLG8_STYPI|nr:uncharacterized protein LOC111323246 [Stylophora pistillata]PFX30741.1 hypothetical protein AWC38_SpisGene4486 [Stylophora pistillata]
MALTLILRRTFRCRSFKRTFIFAVVILVQLWLAIPALFGQRGDIWPQEFNVVFPRNFQAPFVPLVIFSSYRPKYLERTLESISSSGSIVPSTPCLFILHHTKASTMDDINETYKVLGKITFCRKLVWTFGNEEEERSPEVLKAHWWNTMKKVFDEHDAFQLKHNETFSGDVLFVEDDLVVAADFMEVMWYSLLVKNSVPNIHFSTLQGVGEENLVDHQPDAFVVSEVPLVQSIGYSFNSSMWEYIKTFQDDALGHAEGDWPLYLGLMLLYNRNSTIFRIVSPTISRIWHVGDNDLGSSADPGASSKYKPDQFPPWKRARERRYLNRNKANVLPGVRDMHGRLCHPCEMESRTYKFSRGSYNCRCLCPTSNLQKYVNWQMGAFVSDVNQGMHCTLVSHLMTMVVFVFVGILLFVYLMSSH